MSSPERRRLNRLERRCDWLLARIAIGESEGREMGRDNAEYSALRWLIDAFGTQHVDLVTENQALRQTINHQRRAIRRLLAWQQPGALSDSELDALVDVVVSSPSAPVAADAASHLLSARCRQGSGSSESAGAVGKGPGGDA